MYSIPADFNCNVLNNAILDQISYSINSIVLDFDNKYSIAIDGSFVVRIGQQDYSYEEIFPVRSDFSLLLLLDKRIIQAAANDKRDKLLLIFENDTQINLISHPIYESFSIYFGDNRIII